MEAFADWDLLAVVRSCCTTTTTTTTATASPVEAQPSPPPAVVKKEPCFATNSSSSSASNELLFGFPTITALFDPSTTSFFSPRQQELPDNVCKPRLISPVSSSSSSSLASPVSSASSSVVAGGSFRVGEPPELRRLIRPAQVVFGAPPASSTTQSQRTKKRKNLVKKVFHVPAEGLSNDMWAWRKYGQKPIKGSPYPRGYYRCSSSKVCLARKQVERNRSDPKMFIVTYTGEHSHPMPTHRNSLAGSTRPKPTTGNPPVAVAGESQDQPTSSGSPPTEKSESKTEEDDPIKEDEDDDMGLSDLILNDDFYVGFEKIDGADLDEGFSGHFSPPMELPWLSGGAGTAAAAGGR